MVKLKSHKKILDLIRIKKHSLHAAIREHVDERLADENENKNTARFIKTWYNRFRDFIFYFDSRSFALNNRGFANHYLAYLQGLSYGNKSIRVHFDILISILNRLNIPHDINTRELFRGFAKQSKANEDFFLTDEEVKELLSIAGEDKFESAVETVIMHRFILACFTGCRVSEIKTLKVEDDNTLKYTSNKTKKDILIPFSNPIKGLFGRGMWRRELDAYNEGNPNETVHRVLERLGWDKPVTRYKMYGKKKVSEELPRHKAITFHSGRKFFGKMLLDRGIPMAMVSQMMGHENINITQKYYAALTREKVINQSMEVINKF